MDGFISRYLSSYRDETIGLFFLARLYLVQLMINLYQASEVPRTNLSEIDLKEYFGKALSQH